MIFDPEVLNSLPMVTSGAEPEFGAQMLDLFETTSADLMTAIDGALDRGDADALRRSLHTLGSSAAQVGALALSEAAVCWEHALRAGHPTAPDALVQLWASYRALTAELRAHRASVAARPIMACRDGTQNCP